MDEQIEQDERAPRRRQVVIMVVAAALLAGVAGAGLWWSTKGTPEAEVASATTVPTTTSTTTTTTAPAPAGPVAPLTGVVVGPEEAALLQRPALVAKIDNHADAVPQVGLNAADIVIELQVEGITRYMAVFHSQDVGTIGPIRSARTSDPSLLAAFGRPLVAWSGGNQGVIRAMSRANIQSVNHDQAEAAYSRSRDRRAPHNLMVDGRALFALAQDRTPPQPQFAYRTNEQPPAGVPAAGVTVRLEGAAASYVWDEARSGWLRWTGVTPLNGDDGLQLAPANVVVLATPYRASSADARSPEAATTGSGRAWVFSAGTVQTGTWNRPNDTSPWSLVGDDGAPILLTPGRTWVELPSPGLDPEVMTPEQAAGLRG